jgi:uncharacterized membrane protein YraQ (UPF0718 family)
VADVPIEAGGRLLKLSDVAVVRAGLEDPPQFTVRHNGQPVLMLGVTFERSGNILKLGAELDQRLATLQSGLPLGVTFSFLISSPLVDMASVILLASIFSWPIALAYVGVGLLVAIIGGTIIGKLGMEDQVAGFVRNVPVTDTDETLTRSERVTFARDQVLDIIHKVWPYVLIGVGIGAAIHNWVPAETISALLGQDKWWAVPVATLVGIPMYADIFGTLPIAEALVGKGVGLGTVLAFMMAVVALSLPEMLILRKVVKWQLLGIFAAYLATAFVFVGVLFNALRTVL